MRTIISYLDVDSPNKSSDSALDPPPSASSPREVVNFKDHDSESMFSFSSDEFEDCVEDTWTDGMEKYVEETFHRIIAPADTKKTASFVEVLVIECARLKHDCDRVRYT